jgi:excisionase family DNA binding protein
MPEQILWSLDETARQLGGLSTRTVRRMVDSGELPMVKVGRTVRIPAADVHQWVAHNMRPAHNQNRVGSGVRSKEVNACRTVVREVRFGGCRTSNQAARELGDLLELPIARKRRP